MPEPLLLRHATFCTFYKQFISLGFVFHGDKYFSRGRLFCIPHLLLPGGNCPLPSYDPPAQRHLHGTGLLSPVIAHCGHFDG